MKKLIAAFLSLCFAVTLQAGVVTFQGVVDEVRPPSQFEVGDTFTGTFVYNPHSRIISWFEIKIGRTSFSGKRLGGMFVFDDAPISGSVFYQVIDLNEVEITLQAATPNGVIPPVSEFNLNDFAIFNDTFGHLTSLPVHHPK